MSLNRASFLVLLFLGMLSPFNQARGEATPTPEVSPEGSSGRAACYDASGVVAEIAPKAATLLNRMRDVPINGQLSESENELGEIEEAYRRALKDCAQLPEASYGLGLILRARKKYTDARAAFAEALAQRPDESAYLLAAALTEKDLSNFDQAEVYARRVLESAPKEVRALQMLAILAEATGDRAKAIEYLEQARTAQPADAVTWFNLAVLYERADQYDAARVAFERAHTLSPSHVDTLLYLGRAQRRAGDESGAMRTLQRAAEIAPHDSRVQLALGAVLDGSGEGERALLALRRALDAEPKNLDAWISYAILQLDAGLLDDALESAHEAIRVGSADPRGYGVRGWAELELGKVGEAVRSFEQARTLSPAKPAALLSLAVAMERVGRKEEAEALLSELDSSASYDQNASGLNAGGAAARAERMGRWRMWRGQE